MLNIEICKDIDNQDMPISILYRDENKISKEPEDIKLAPTSVQNAVKEILNYVVARQNAKEVVHDKAIDFIKKKASAEEKQGLISLFPKLETGDMIVEGEEYDYKGTLYKAKKSTKFEGLNFETVELVGAPRVREYFRPDLDNTYDFGDVILFRDNKLYQSKIQNNSYTPTTYPEAWQEINSATEVKNDRN